MPTCIVRNPRFVILFSVSQDFTGVPAVVDLACMRDAMNNLGGDSNKINPLVSYTLILMDAIVLIKATFFLNCSFCKYLEKCFKCWYVMKIMMCAGSCRSCY